VLTYKKENKMPTKFICDIGANHNADFNRLTRLVKTAKRIGCDGVKGQLFNENLYAPQFKQQRDMMAKRAMPEGFIIELHKLCKDEGLEFHMTPFSLEAVDKLANWVDGLKIGSYEILWLDLIRKCLETDLPVGISTGNCNEKDLWNVSDMMDDLELLHPDDPPHTLYHCIGHYPANPDTSNLKNIKELNRIFCFDFKIGYSDHTRSPGVIYRAIMVGAEAIEFHLDLDGEGWEFEHGHCWLPAEIQEVISNVRIGELAVSGERSDDSEIRKWRTDPVDGMRPLAQYREELSK